MPNDAAAAMRPLEGVTVLDLTQFLSGPYCTQILGDLGAEIIKLESPEGDLARHIPPYFREGSSLYFHAINRNKSSIVVNLKSERGLAIARDLIATCDIVVENFRPGVLDRLGLSAAELCREHPRLIWASISGFGQDGPYRNKPAYDMIVQALSGGMSLTGEPGGTAVRSGIPIGDLSAGMYAAIAALSAMVRRGITGRGAICDISMLDVQAAMLCYQAAYFLHSGVVPGRQGTAHDSIPTYRGFTCAEGTELVITANTERMWRGLCRVLGLDHLADDPRFVTNRERHQNRAALAELLEAAMRRRRADEWVPLLEAEGIPVGVVNTLDKVMADPQLRHRAMIEEMPARAGGPLRVMANPVKFVGEPATASIPPPVLGSATAAVLARHLGLAPAEIARLDREGVIATAGTPADA
ncbi:CaiB/BaiF CoA transferase family protein [Propylenella binzhouense]|uniref:CoA transferase n=1 Tax=Propylenella binzhouense TaxID=2555902 RepID=A0A964T2F0_9HYPH|nr:CoA transferase [Propylenella binzhouense]MYZ46362.1 CoA transferase [Propylenella binzhouense]